MRMKFAFLTGILAFGASLQGATSYLLDFNTYSTTPGLVKDSGYAVSPYTGTVNGTTVQLYCDDFNDTIAYGQQNLAVYSTALFQVASTPGQVRYEVHNAPGNSYTAGTTLYQEMAWLATQMQHTTGANAQANNIAIQEAIWTLTDASSGATAPHNSSVNTTGTAASGLGGAAQSYLSWIADAQAYVTAFNGGASWQYTSSYSALVTSSWYIITAVQSAGCTIGSETNGCSGAGGTGTGTSGSGTTTQEFLAYAPGGLVTTTGAAPGVPEPASFILIGSGLFAGAFFARRRKA
jgi:hypothetical protein